jgi:hypothetical protein
MDRKIFQKRNKGVWRIGILVHDEGHQPEQERKISLETNN